jgi:hypothetical protein
MHRQRHFSTRQRLPPLPAARGHAAGQCQRGRASGGRDCRAGLIPGGAAPFRTAAHRRPETPGARIQRPSRTGPGGRARRSHLPVSGALPRPGDNSRPRRRRACDPPRRDAGDVHEAGAPGGAPAPEAGPVHNRNGAEVPVQGTGEATGIRPAEREKQALARIPDDRVNPAMPVQAGLADMADIVAAGHIRGHGQRPRCLGPPRGAMIIGPHAPGLRRRHSEAARSPRRFPAQRM